jgi:hypothetical protein
MRKPTAAASRHACVYSVLGFITHVFSSRKAIAGFQGNNLPDRRLGGDCVVPKRRAVTMALYGRLRALSLFALKMER